MKNIINIFMIVLAIVIVSLIINIVPNDSQKSNNKQTISENNTNTSENTKKEVETPKTNVVENEIAKNTPKTDNTDNNLQTKVMLPAYSLDYIEKRNPENDFQDAIKTAQQTNKKIFMIAGGNWCPWCNALDKFFKQNPDATKYLFDNFVVIKIYIDRKFTINKKFFDKFAEVPSTPSFYLFNKNGKFMINFETTPLEVGGGAQNGYKKKAIMDLLTEWNNSQG